jgi:hypothetical protein
MPKRLVFIEVDQEGKPVLWPSVAAVMYCEDEGCEWCSHAKGNVAEAIASLPSASEALVEAIAKIVQQTADDCSIYIKPEEATQEARTLISRLEADQP